MVNARGRDLDQPLRVQGKGPLPSLGPACANLRQLAPAIMPTVRGHTFIRVPSPSPSPSPDVGFGLGGGLNDTGGGEAASFSPSSRPPSSRPPSALSRGRPGSSSEPDHLSSSPSPPPPPSQQLSAILSSSSSFADYIPRTAKPLRHQNHRPHSALPSTLRPKSAYTKRPGTGLPPQPSLPLPHSTYSTSALYAQRQSPPPRNNKNNNKGVTVEVAIAARSATRSSTTTTSITSPRKLYQKHTLDVCRAIAPTGIPLSLIPPQLRESFSAAAASLRDQDAAQIETQVFKNTFSKPSNRHPSRLPKLGRSPRPSASPETSRAFRSHGT